MPFPISFINLERTQLIDSPIRLHSCLKQVVHFPIVLVNHNPVKVTLQRQRRLRDITHVRIAIVEFTPVVLYKRFYPISLVWNNTLSRADLNFIKWGTSWNWCLHFLFCFGTNQELRIFWGGANTAWHAFPITFILAEVLGSAVASIRIC